MAEKLLPGDSGSETTRIFEIHEVTILSWLLVKCCRAIIDIGYFKRPVLIGLVDTHFTKLTLI